MPVVYGNNRPVIPETFSFRINFRHSRRPKTSTGRNVIHRSYLIHVVFDTCVKFSVLGGLLYVVLRTDGFITRLSCKSSANFTETYAHQYFNGMILRMLKNKTKIECALYCTTNSKCVFFNHKIDNAACELVGSRIGVWQNKAGWQIVSTDYKRLKNVRINIIKIWNYLFELLIT